MNDIELETLKNYARIIKAFCKKQGDNCSNCPFVRDLAIDGNCLIGVVMGDVECLPEMWEV